MKLQLALSSVSSGVAAMPFVRQQLMGMGMVFNLLKVEVTLDLVET
jgi:hypothetical protein